MKRTGKGRIINRINDSATPLKTSLSKSMQLEYLFQEWENAQRNEPDDVWKMTNGGNENITKDHFRRDGIIDESTFEKERVKVLFISAEANDNDYSAQTCHKPNSVDDYRTYHVIGNETWKGRMRERLAELYKVISGTERGSMSNPEAVMHFAVMDINKRGGSAQIGNGSHIKAYCKYYQSFIRREIEIISSDIVAMIGLNIYDMKLHTKYLGAVEENGRAYFEINRKRVPILRLWQTSYRYCKNEPLPGYENDVLVGRHAAKCLEELERFGIANKFNPSKKPEIRAYECSDAEEPQRAVKTITCPCCNSDISFEQSSSRCTCEFCGAVFELDDDEIREYVKNQYVEESRAKQSQSQNEQKQNEYLNYTNINKKNDFQNNKVIALLLCIFFGMFGAHHFYCKRYVLGVIYLFTFGLIGVGWFIDIVLIVAGLYRDATGQYLR